MQRIANHQDSKNLGSLGQEECGVIEDWGRGRLWDKETAAFIFQVHFSIIYNKPGLLLQCFLFCCVLFCLKKKTKPDNRLTSEAQVHRGYLLERQQRPVGWGGGQPLWPANGAAPE